MNTITLTGRLTKDSVSNREITATLEIEKPYEHSVTITFTPAEGQDRSEMFETIFDHFDTDVSVRCSIDDQGSLNATSNDISTSEAFSPRKDDRYVAGSLESHASMLESLSRTYINGKYHADVDDMVEDMRRAAAILKNVDDVLWDAAMKRIAGNTSTS